MSILPYINLATLLSVLGLVLKLSFRAGSLSQQVKDRFDSLERRMGEIERRCEGRLVNGHLVCPLERGD